MANDNPYAYFFLNGPSNVVHLDAIEISHPSFSKVYYIVRNAMNGITATLETGDIQAFDYYPLAITPTHASDDLDQTIEVSLGDLGTVIPQELDICMAASTMLTKPTLIYRVYRSDDLTKPIDGPFRYEIQIVASKEDKTTFAAGAPKLNRNQTGEQYRLDRFPMLRGFL